MHVNGEQGNAAPEREPTLTDIRNSISDKIDAGELAVA